MPSNSETPSPRGLVAEKAGAATAESSKTWPPAIYATSEPMERQRVLLPASSASIPTLCENGRSKTAPQTATVASVPLTSWTPTNAACRATWLLAKPSGPSGWSRRGRASFKALRALVIGPIGRGTPRWKGPISAIESLDYGFEVGRDQERYRFTDTYEADLPAKRMQRGDSEAVNLIDVYNRTYAVEPAAPERPGSSPRPRTR